VTHAILTPLLRAALPLSLCTLASLGASSACDSSGGSDESMGGSKHESSEDDPTHEASDSDAPPPRRVVGYLPTYRDLTVERLNLDALTHLCIAFANPTGTGSESDFDEGARDYITPIVEAAHEKGVLVLASIAGGTQESGELVAAQIVPERVDDYVAGLLDVIDRYDLDGIDNDIEGEAVNEDYETFVLKLDAALPKGKLLTAAVATKNGDPVPDTALEAYDFINIMAYDHCSWADEPCDQAGIEGVQEDLIYWTETRSVPRNKTVLGVPFYGWCWGCSEKQTAMTYSQILRQYPEARESDWIEDGAITISLNSANTIAEKAELAKEYGGIMIWELGQDTRGEDSLLEVVDAAQ